jgi:hypothetical protein
MASTLRRRAQRGKVRGVHDEDRLDDINAIFARMKQGAIEVEPWCALLQTLDRHGQDLSGRIGALP